jgi:hypothetical protein
MHDTSIHHDLCTNYLSPYHIILLYIKSTWKNIYPIEFPLFPSPSRLCPIIANEPRTLKKGKLINKINKHLKYGGLSLVLCQLPHSPLSPNGKHLRRSIRYQNEKQIQIESDCRWSLPSPSAPPRPRSAARRRDLTCHCHSRRGVC